MAGQSTVQTTTVLFHLHQNNTKLFLLRKNRLDHLWKLERKKGINLNHFNNLAVQTDSKEGDV